ncbi:MAG: hypothetical protein L0L52_09085 [Staphylococcus equorum]|nr:hypothetical protein [Staphylococcus equorum]
METYENKIAIESCVKTIHKQQCTEHKVQSMIDELEMAYDKAKAFDIFIKYKQHVEKYNNSDCHELERVFQGVMKEYEEDK